MKLPSTLARFQTSLEMWLVGPLAPIVRRDMYIDLSAAMTMSLLSTAITFIPIILRRSGATNQQVAYYFAITTMGLLTTNAGLWLMRRLGMKRVALVCWLIGRGSFLLAAWAYNATFLLVIFTIFWVLEAWPSPAYFQIIQNIYPIQQRGRILAAVRVGLVTLILILTPLAGWMLDHWSYRVLLPLAGVSGISATLIFNKLVRKMPNEMAETSQKSASAAVILKTDRRMWFYLSATLMFGLGALISAPLYSIIQVDQLNLSYTVIGLLGFVQSSFWLIGYLFGGRLLDRIGGISGLQIVFIINAMVILPYIWATQAWMLLPSVIAAGLVTAGADLAILYTVTYLAGPDRVPDYAALNATVAGFRGLLGPFIGLFLVSNGWPYWAVFLLSAGLTLTGALVLNVIKRIPQPVAV
jgi:MFS family permease